MDHDSIERAAESTFAKALGRYGTPLLLTIIGGLVWRGIDDLKQGQEDQDRSMTAQTERTGQIAADVRVLTTRVDEALIGRIRDLERRIEVIESDHRERDLQ